jgi:hypothetical protein
MPVAIPEGWEPQQQGTDRLHDAAKRFVRPERPIFRKRIQGDHPNVDVSLKAPR